MTESQQRWIPLESNPDVLNKYMHNLGVPKSWEFVDVYGLDADLLGMVPQPTYAVVLLYPITEKSESKAIGEEKEGHEMYFVKQTISNACGTIAIVHCLATNHKGMNLEGDKPFKKFLEDTKDKSPAERATSLEENKDMGMAHEDSAQEGQTQAPSREEKVKTHFVAFVHHDGGLYELNGRCKGPVYHGETTQDGLLKDTAAVVKKFMERDPEELSFTLMALVKPES